MRHKPGPPWPRSTKPSALVIPMQPCGLEADIAFARAVKSQRSGVTATVHGEVAWVSSTSTTAGTYNGKAVHLNGAELIVLTKAPSGWLIRAIHWSSNERK